MIFQNPVYSFVIILLVIHLCRMKLQYILIPWIIDPTHSKSIAPCIDTITKMEHAYYNLATRGTNSSIYDENDFQFWKLTPHVLQYQQCIGCSKKTQGLCPTSPDIPCQPLIDELYNHCDGVTLPPGYFYNPPVSYTHIISNQNDTDSNQMSNSITIFVSILFFRNLPLPDTGMMIMCKSNYELVLENVVAIEEDH